MTVLLFTPVLLLVSSIWVQVAQTQEGVDCRGAAICQIDNATAYGTIRLVRKYANEPMVVYGEVGRLSEGLHGFHVHQYGDLSNGCKNAGEHLNPYNNNHGDEYDADRHVGDLANIGAEKNGVAQVLKVDYLLRFCGPNSIYGRAIVVHADRDDLGRGGNEESLKNGNSGARVGCCVIQPTIIPA